MQMFNEKVAVKRIEHSKSDGGIIIPDINPNADIHFGIVKAKGIIESREGKYLKVGDKVMYMHHNLNPTYKELEIVPFKEIILKDNSIKNAD